MTHVTHCDAFPIEGIVLKTKATLENASQCVTTFNVRHTYDGALPDRPKEMHRQTYLCLRRSQDAAAARLGF